MNVSKIDIDHLNKIRSTVNGLFSDAATIYDVENTLILDIAPQDNGGAKNYFKNAKIKTLDIDPKTNPDFVCDLADANIISSKTFDVIFCTEVLEHTKDPFSCAKTIHRILKDSGVAFVTTPFNFRIHGPLPDNWRFSEHGLRILFNCFSEISIIPIESDRFLMPIQYITKLTK